MRRYIALALVAAVFGFLSFSASYGQQVLIFVHKICFSHSKKYTELRDKYGSQLKAAFFLSVGVIFSLYKFHIESLQLYHMMWAVSMLVFWITVHLTAGSIRISSDPTHHLYHQINGELSSQSCRKEP